MAAALQAPHTELLLRAVPLSGVTAAVGYPLPCSLRDYDGGGNV